eukprot:6096906-Amphidinium_carterae.1
MMCAAQTTCVLCSERQRHLQRAPPNHPQMLKQGTSAKSKSGSLQSFRSNREETTHQNNGMTRKQHAWTVICPLPYKPP